MPCSWIALARCHHGLPAGRPAAGQIRTAIAQARNAFESAIRLDPGYARAYAGRAYALCDVGMNPPTNFSAAQIADPGREESRRRRQRKGRRG